MELALELLVKKLCSKIIELSHLVYTDQTGKFLVKSMSGNNYLMVLRDYDTNHMLSEPIPGRKSQLFETLSSNYLMQ